MATNIDLTLLGLSCLRINFGQEPPAFLRLHPKETTSTSGNKRLSALNYSALHPNTLA
jgi:hypothetical protein